MHGALVQRQEGKTDSEISRELPTECDERRTLYKQKVAQLSQLMEYIQQNGDETTSLLEIVGQIRLTINEWAKDTYECAFNHYRSITETNRLLAVQNDTAVQRTNPITSSGT